MGFSVSLQNVDSNINFLNTIFAVTPRVGKHIVNYTLIELRSCFQISVYTIIITYKSRNCLVLTVTSLISRCELILSYELAY